MSLNDWTAAEVAAKLSKPGRGKSKKTSRGWMACCPAHNDRTPSLSLADGREGVLLYHCFGGCSPDDVRSSLQSLLGESPDARENEPRRQKQKRRVEAPKEEYEVITPVPADQIGVRPEDFEHFEYGCPTKIWTYYLESGDVAGWIVRYDFPDGGKEVIPWTWTRSTLNGREKLRMKGMASPRPLYNLKGILENEESPVLWNEGEKAADAAQKLFPSWVSTACAGGGNAIGLTDFSPLYGRKVIIACDHDASGYQAGAKIADMLMDHCDVYFLRWPTKRADGSGYEIQAKDDAADHLARGWTREELKAVVEDGHRLTYPIREIAPAFDIIHYDRNSERRFQMG